MRKFFRHQKNPETIVRTVRTVRDQSGGSHVWLAGFLDRVAGLIIRAFDETDAKEVDVLVREHRSRLKVPVIPNFLVGHTPYPA